MVHHQLLQSIDRELFSYIEAKKTEPQMYLQRWLRCMLSREFNLADTIELWDAIFANYSLEPEKEFIFLDYLCVAMMAFVRTFLLQADQSGILRRLLKFPPVEDVHILVGMALKYKNRAVSPPKSFQRIESLPTPTPFLQPTRLIADKTPPKIPSTFHNSQNNINAFVEDAIGIVSEIIDEKNLQAGKLQRAIEAVNKIKNHFEKQPSTASVLDPLSRPRK